MHELSIAAAVVAEVERAATEHGIASVTSVTLRIGRLSGVVADALELGFEIASRGTCIDGSALVVEPDPVVAWCPVGGHSIELDDLVLRCPTHDCPTSELISGQALQIVRFEGVEDDVAARR